MPWCFSPPAIFQIDTYCCLCTNMLSEVLLFLSQYLTLCGDIQLMLAQNASNRAAHLEEFHYQTKEDQEILHSLHRESSCQGMPERPLGAQWGCPQAHACLSPDKWQKHKLFHVCSIVSFLVLKSSMILLLLKGFKIFYNHCWL